jgi:NADP-dependent 3-hydroxy acid dehydrogenase YdfG
MSGTTGTIEGKVVVITGASSGIGEATARLLAQRGAQVVLGARRTERLAALVAELRGEGCTASFAATDVTRLDAMQSLFKFAQESHGHVDVFINNAGIMPLSTLDQLKIDEWNRMIDVNIRGVLHGIAAALPHFKERKSGQFINVSSLGGHKAIATAAVYCGTKFAVHAISEALRQEVGGDIRVTIVSPGVVESDLAETISDPATKKVIDAFRQISIKPESIARAIAFSIEQPDDVDVSEIIVRPTASEY